VTSASLDAINLIGSLVYVFTIPLAAIAVTLLYLDLVDRPAGLRKGPVLRIVHSVRQRRRLRGSDSLGRVDALGRTMKGMVFGKASRHAHDLAAEGFEL
jgi:hypothetical protein